MNFWVKYEYKINTMDKNDRIKKWVEMAESDLDTAKYLFKSKKYLWSMFIIHLVVEKLLKACILKNTTSEPPHIHDLERLSKIAQLELSDDDKKILRKLTKAQIAARYDTYKQKVMEEFSPAFVDIFFPKVINFYKCIKKKI